MSFQKLIIGGQRANIALVRTIHQSGTPCYFYIEVDRVRRPLLQRFVAGAAIRINEFGRLLQWGYGENPAPDHAAEMAEKYGFEPA